MSNKDFGDRPVSRPVQERRQADTNRPEYVDKIPRQVMFTTAGQTGWRRRRDISRHKGADMKEDNFSDQHHRFTEEEG